MPHEEVWRYGWGLANQHHLNYLSVRNADGQYREHFELYGRYLR